MREQQQGRTRILGNTHSKPWARIFAAVGGAGLAEAETEARRPARRSGQRRPFPLSIQGRSLRAASLPA